MIFTSPIQDIEWSTIEDFCNQKIPEGTFLDYKEQFPKNLEKTIAALANTHGGLVLIGIEEDATNKPITPIKGIDFQRGLSEKVINIILSNITPPIIPEIKVCQDDTMEKAIIIIRVPASEIPPHAISKNTAVYIRTNDLNNPEEIASIEHTEWLKNKRKKSIDLKLDLIEQSQSRFSEMKMLASDNNKDLYIGYSDLDKNILEITISPLYPFDWLKTPLQIKEFFDEIKIKDPYQTSSNFPPYDSNTTQSGINISQDGVYLVYAYNDRFFYTELNSFGLCFYKQNIRSRKQDTQTKPYISLSEIKSRIQSFMRVSENFFKKSGYWGLVEISISLENILLSGLCDIPNNPNEFIGLCPDNFFTIKRTVLAHGISDNINDIMEWATQRIGWLFGLNLL